MSLSRASRAGRAYTELTLLRPDTQDASERMGKQAEAPVPAVSTSRAESKHKARLALGLLLLVFLALSTAYNLAVPPGEAPDEISHAQFTEVLLRTGQLPTIPRDSARYSYEAEQPPLYYLLLAGWAKLTGQGTGGGSRLFPQLQGNPLFSFSSDAVPNMYLHNEPQSELWSVRLLRLLSVLFGLVTLVMIWKAARVAWPDDNAAAVLSTGFAALLPGFTFTSGTLTNDTLAATTGAATLWAILSMIRGGLRGQAIILAGLILGLGLLTKRSLLVLLPLVALAPLLTANCALRNRLLAVGAVLAIALTVGIWPLVGNMVQYGDPLATHVTMLAKEELASPLAHMPGFWIMPFYMTGLFNSLWGVFGPRTIELPAILYDFYYLLMIVGLVWATFSMRGKSVEERKIAAVLVGTILLVYAALAYHNTQFWAIQGRLLLPALAALALLIGRGLSVLGSKALSIRAARQWATGLILAFMAGLNVYALTSHIIAIYH